MHGTDECALTTTDHSPAKLFHVVESNVIKAIESRVKPAMPAGRDQTSSFVR
jgi:hypothetical protein